jgi:hypothetical protein
MANHTSAILAINSLDRYINSKVEVNTAFDAIWTTGQNTITYTTGAVPVVGATLTSAGIPANTAITAFSSLVSNLTGSWLSNTAIAFIYTGVPVVGGYLFGQQGTLSGIITLVVPFPSGNGYRVNVDQTNEVDSGALNIFQATWVTGQNTVLRVSGPLPNVGDGMFAGVNVVGIVTNIVGNTITFNGLTQTTQVAPAPVFSTLPVPIQQTFDTVTISQNTTTTQAVAQGVRQAYSVNNENQPVTNILAASYNDSSPFCYDFTIQSPSALIYGYINKIIISQIQLQYNIPTVVKGRNDELVIATAGPTLTGITIPYGFYYADELAAALQTLITANPTLAPLNMTVTFVPRQGFVFQSTAGTPFYFPDPTGVVGAEPLYKVYRLLGMTIANAVPAVNQTSFQYPNLLYTPYIDIYSKILTNYQNIKDTNSSPEKPSGLVSRIYLSGTGNIQATGSLSALGTASFVMTSDLNTPKVIQWSPDVAVPSIDFQLKDQYGDFIPGAEDGYSTEFQMTLLCTEER